MKISDDALRKEMEYAASAFRDMPGWMQRIAKQERLMTHRCCDCGSDNCCCPTEKTRVVMNHKRKTQKIKTKNGYLPGDGDGPRGNSKSDQKKAEKLSDIRASESATEAQMLIDTKIVKRVISAYLNYCDTTETDELLENAMSDLMRVYLKDKGVE